MKIRINQKNVLAFICLISIGVFLSPSQAFADSIAHVGTAATGSGSGTSLTFSQTVGSGSNLMEVVIVFATDTTVSGVTIGGTPMTLAVSKKYSGNNDSVYEYYLANPPTGSQNIVISDPGSPGALFGVATTYSGVNQAAPEATGTNTQNSNSNMTVSVTTLTNNAWAIGGIFQNDGTLSAAAGTIRGQVSDTVLIDNGPKTPAGSVSVTTHPSSTANEAVGVVASFAPATSAPSFGDIIFFQ